MPLDDYLKRRYSELQKEYDDLSEEIEYLRNSKRIETLSPKESFKLQKQIRDLEEKREIVNQKLEDLDKTSNSEQLYRTLLKLGYEKQVQLFVRLIQAQSVGAFLIHGSLKYGQRWLLNRLVDQYVPYSISGKRIKIELSRSVGRTDVDSLWRELGNQVGKRSQQLSPLEIAEGVYRWWQTENVLLVFHDVNLMPKDYLEKLISDFWNPLVNKAREVTSNSKYQLIMFLVDYEGSVGNLDSLFAEQVDSTQLDTPLRPPCISKFTPDNVTNWMLAEFEELPIELTHNVDDAVQNILSESDKGIPEYVLAGIFERCGYNYYNEVERLWKL